MPTGSEPFYFMPGLFLRKSAALMPKKTRKRTNRLPYTLGEVNKWIDSTVHPLTKAHPELWIVDGALHAIVEQDLELSIRKFIRYDLAKILEQLIKGRKK